MPHPTWHELYNAALVELISLNFLNVSRPHVRQFINTEYRKDILSLRRNARSSTMHCECCSR